MYLLGRYSIAQVMLLTPAEQMRIPVHPGHLRISLDKLVSEDWNFTVVIYLFCPNI